MPNGIRNAGPETVSKNRPRAINRTAGIKFHFPRRRNGIQRIIHQPIICRKLKYIYRPSPIAKWIKTEATRAIPTLQSVTGGICTLISCR